MVQDCTYIESQAKCCSYCHLTKRIHAIRTQIEPYIPRIHCKVFVGSIYFSPLGSISWVSQHCVFLSFFFVPSHQLSMLFISKQMLQTWYYRYTLPGMLALDIPRVLYPDLIPQCTACGTCI
jgi:hypothetical protein